MKNIKRLIRGKEKGFTLLEILLSIVLLGILSIAFSSAFITSFKVLAQTDARETAKNLAETEMEYVRDDSTNPFNMSAVTYPLDPRLTIPSGYFINIAVSSVPLRDVNIQKIIISVTSLGTTYVLENFKINPLIR